MSEFNPSVSVARPEIVSKRGELVRTGNTVDTPYVFYPLDDPLSYVKAKIEAPDCFEVYEVVETDDFGDVDLSGMTLDKVWRLAEIAAETEEPLAFCAWVGIKGGGRFVNLDKAADRFARAFRGVFDSLDDYAEDWAKDQRLDEILWPHVDWEGLGASLAMDYKQIEIDGGRIALFAQI